MERPTGGIWIESRTDSGHNDGGSRCGIRLEFSGQAMVVGKFPVLASGSLKPFAVSGHVPAGVDWRRCTRLAVWCRLREVKDVDQS